MNTLNKDMKLKAVIFDLDGVIINSMPFYFESWRLTFQRIGITISEREIYRCEGVGSEITAREIYKKYLKVAPNRKIIDSILNTQDMYFDNLYQLELMPGIDNLLEKLHKNGIILCMVTGSTNPMRKLAKCNEIVDLFKVIISGKDTRRRKPYPDPYLKAIEFLDINKDECYVIENSPLGVRSAVSAGLCCLAINSSPFISDEELFKSGASNCYHNLGEIISILC